MRLKMSKLGKSNRRAIAVKFPHTVFMGKCFYRIRG
jgi:hypothetical protein